MKSNDFFLLLLSVATIASSIIYGLSWAISTLVVIASVLLIAFLQFEKYASSKNIALLSVLAAVTVVLRQMIHGIGVSPVFFMVTLTGYVFGPANGFLLGATTMLVSNFSVGGNGPWTPYQMIGAGLVGFSAGILPKTKNKKLTVAVLSAYSFASAYMYAVITDIFWWLTFTSQHTLATYVAIVSAGLISDIALSLGNVFFLLLLGLPLLRILERFRKKFYTTYSIN